MDKKAQKRAMLEWQITPIYNNNLKTPWYFNIPIFYALLSVPRRVYSMQTDNSSSMDDRINM